MEITMAEPVKITMDLDNLRAAMARRGWQAVDLAAAAGVDKSTLSLILSEQRTSNTAAVVARLALALGVSVDHLLGLTTDPSPKRTDLSRLIVSLLEAARALPATRQRDLLLIAQTFSRDAQGVERLSFEELLFESLEGEYGRAVAEEIMHELAKLLPGGGADTPRQQRSA